MIRTLAGVGSPLPEVEADVIVVGAGIAGLLLAQRLSQSGKRVLVLESGGETQEGDTHPLNEVVHARSVYGGADHGRSRCLGGTSDRWGGAMLPYLAADLEGVWPIEPWALTAYAPEVERLFGLPSGRYDFPEMAQPRDGVIPSYLPRLAKWPAFRRRNVATVLRQELAGREGPQIWLNATVTDFLFEADGRLTGVEARATDGGRLNARAPEIVVAGGAIESTRLLLLMNRRCDSRLFSPEGPLGRYFHDHISVCVARVSPADRARLNRTVGFRFEAGGMRNLRFEPAENARARANAVPGFAHLAFTAAEGGSFDALRALFRAMQQRRLPSATAMIGLMRDAPWLAEALWWRLIERRLLYPRGSAIELHVVVQQHPVPQNRISLATDRVDAVGSPLAVIEWEVSQSDKAAVGEAADRFQAFWRSTSLAELGRIEERPQAEVLADLSSSVGIYHPAGSTRMGLSVRDGVVDSDFRVFGVPNLSVASTSAFPTVGGANPTMTLMMAALLIADRLSKAAA